jgi:hypothetical protein
VNQSQAGASKSSAVDTETISGFEEAARHAARIITSDAVRERWLAPSAVRLMSVGDLASHMFLIVRRVQKHIEAFNAECTDSDAVSDPTWTWLRIEDPEDLSLPENRAVRDDASRIAQWGPDQVATAYLARLENIGTLLADAVPPVVTIGGRRLPFGFYLETRIVELLVHADDLAVSVGEDAEPPPAASGIALRMLIAGVRGLHGDKAVLRVFTRAERAKGNISVF